MEYKWNFSSNNISLTIEQLKSKTNRSRTYGNDVNETPIRLFIDNFRISFKKRPSPYYLYIILCIVINGLRTIDNFKFNEIHTFNNTWFIPPIIKTDCKPISLVHDNFYKQQKKFKFGQIIWWKYLYNVLKISNFEEIFQDSLWLLTSRHHRAKIANYSTSCTPISEKQSICRASSLWQR